MKESEGLCLTTGLPCARFELHGNAASRASRGNVPRGGNGHLEGNECDCETLSFGVSLISELYVCGLT